ncbi:hypothetical protein BX666DRAFT_2022291 [Dichotomocladium elegans]|nr:hypothetical protein BX666DRAFT_2022291 [Dichotomocladium elegans]
MDINVEAMLEAPFQEKPVRINHRPMRSALNHPMTNATIIVIPIIAASLIDTRVTPAADAPDRGPAHDRTVPVRITGRGRGLRIEAEDIVAAGRRDDEAHVLAKEAREDDEAMTVAKDRDRRTVFVTQLAARLTSRELDEFFSQAGRVRDAHIITDRHSRRSKGVGYVEFYDEDSVQNALAMSGQKLLGIPVLVQLSEAEKNRIALQAEQARGNQELAYQRLYVGSIHFSLTEEDIKQIFEPFGPLDFVNLHKDPETGRSKGYAFIQYKNPADGKEALEKMNGFDLAGRQLKVGLVTDKVGTIHTSSTLDDEDSAGVSLNPMARTELMQKLAARQTQAIEEDHSQSTSPAPVRPIIPIKASRTIMLNNMFNPAEETEPDWVKDLETDVKEECSKFGEVEHIFLDGESLGEVYLKFRTVEAGEKALEGLNGRWFGGKQISAVFVPEAIYNVKFSL